MTILPSSPVFLLHPNVQAIQHDQNLLLSSYRFRFSAPPLARLIQWQICLIRPARATCEMEFHKTNTLRRAKHSIHVLDTLKIFD